MTNNLFAQRLRVAIAASGITGRQIATACACTPALVSKWTGGRCMPRSSHLCIISYLTGASLDWLMTPEPITLRTVMDDERAELMNAKQAYLTPPRE